MPQVLDDPEEQPMCRTCNGTGEDAGFSSCSSCRGTGIVFTRDEEYVPEPDDFIGDDEWQDAQDAWEGV